jgi:hypothetical protein
MIINHDGCEDELALVGSIPEKEALSAIKALNKFTEISTFSRDNPCLNQNS